MSQGCQIRETGSPPSLQTEGARPISSTTDPKFFAQNGRTALQSPFASSDVQIGMMQSEPVKPGGTRKRTRCLSADLDSNPLSKVPQSSNRQQGPSAAAFPDQSQVTLHRPTPHRPTASTPCCFGVSPATQSLQLNQLRSSSLANSKPTPLAMAAAPNSLATAAALAGTAAAARSSDSDPSDDDKASPTRPARSQECKHCSAPTASDSSEVVSDNSQQISAQPVISHMQAPVPMHNLCQIGTKPNLQLQSQGYNPSAPFLQAPHLTPSPPVMHSSITPFTTYGCPTGYTSSSLSPATTYVVVSGSSPKRAISSSDQYVAAVVQDAQGNSQHVTVAASAISTGGPSYVLPTTLAVPFAPINPMASHHSFGMTGAAQQFMTPMGPCGQTMTGLGPMALGGQAGGFSAMGLGLSSTLGVTQAGYNLLPRAPPTLVPSIHVNVQDKAHCIGPPTNVRIY